MLCCYVVMPVMYSNVKSLLFHENNTTFVVAMFDNQIEMCVLLCVDTDGKGKDSTIWHSTESPPLFGNNARAILVSLSCSHHQDTRSDALHVFSLALTTRQHSCCVRCIGESLMKRYQHGYSSLAATAT